MTSITCKATLRQGRRRRNRRTPNLSSDFNSKLNVGQDQEQLEVKMVRAIDELETSHYLKEVKKVFLDASGGTLPNISTIVCYGVGSIDDSVTARYQLALCVLLQGWLECRRVLIYDPVFNEQERTFLQQYLRLEVISSNEQCKRKVDLDSVGRTLFYMPHLDKPYFNNLLWTNWCRQRLERLWILGNSFNEMACMLPSRIFNEEYGYISRALKLKLVNERPISNQFRFSDVFNDMSLHKFSMNGHGGAAADGEGAKSTSVMDEFDACYSVEPPIYTVDEGEAVF